MDLFLQFKDDHFEMLLWNSGLKIIGFYGHIPLDWYTKPLFKDIHNLFVATR